MVCLWVEEHSEALVCKSNHAVDTYNWIRIFIADYKSRTGSIPTKIIPIKKNEFNKNLKEQGM